MRSNSRARLAGCCGSSRTANTYSFVSSAMSSVGIELIRDLFPNASHLRPQLLGGRSLLSGGFQVRRVLLCRSRRELFRIVVYGECHADQPANLVLDRMVVTIRGGAYLL